MRLVLISDTHGQHWDVDLPEGDALIHAGDLCSDGSIESLQDASLWLKLQRENYEHVVVIAGNHDWPFVHYADLVQRHLRDAGIIYLQDNGVEIKGLHFYGSPWTPRFFNWAFMAPRGEEMRKVWQRVPTNTDVLITHGPPRGILDLTRSEPHAGCDDLRDEVYNRIKPKLHVFGHLHQQGGQKEHHDGILYVNAAQLDDDYELTHKPVVIEI